MRGHTTIFEKIDYMSIFRSGSRIPVACGTLKNVATKKFLCKSYFYPKWPLLEHAQRKLIFTSPLHKNSAKMNECLFTKLTGCY